MPVLFGKSGVVDSSGFFLKIIIILIILLLRELTDFSLPSQPHSLY